MRNSLSYILSIIILLTGCARLPISQKKDIIYDQNTKLGLSVYYPKKVEHPKDVFVFIHGGNWKNGDRFTYNFLGKGMARKGVVAVIIDYRLYPQTNYKGMAMDAVQSVKWVKENITGFGGDTNKIFVSGHSAGGHIAALIATDNHYFDSLKIQNPLKGAILIDPFGLDMNKYLHRNESYEREVYLSVFEKDSINWKNGSPTYHLHKGMPPFLMFVGGRTYPNIVNGSNDFMAALKPYQPDIFITKVPRKKHVGMIFSFANPRKKAYRQIIDFMDKTK